MFRRPGAGEQLAVARVARGQDAVEHVDAARDALHEIDRRADAHQVAGAIGREQRRRLLGDVVHQRNRLADAESADRIRLEADRDRPFDAAPRADPETSRPG